MTLPEFPAPATRRRKGPIVVGIVVLAVLLAGGGVAAVLLRRSAAGATAAAPASAPPPTTVAPTPTEPPAFSGPLQGLVVTKPDGATWAPNERKGDADGSLSKEQAASEYAGDGETEVLKTLTDLEYGRGLFLAWRDHGTLVYIQIYQFRYVRQSAAWLVTQQRELQDIATSTAAIDEIEGGRWFATKAPDGRGGSHAYFGKGPFVVMIDTFRSGTADAAGAKQLAVHQYQKLPA